MLLLLRLLVRDLYNRYLVCPTIQLFQDNEISGANWTSDQKCVDVASTTDQPADDQIDAGHTPGMQPPNPSVPAPGQALEIQEDGSGK